MNDGAALLRSWVGNHAEDAFTRLVHRHGGRLDRGVTIKNIPVGEAQLVWLNQHGADDATACVFLQNPHDGAGSVDHNSLPAGLRGSPNPDFEPPRAADNNRSRATCLSLHREPDGWRLIVPPSAVEKLAQELQSAPRS